MNRRELMIGGMVAAVAGLHAPRSYAQAAYPNGPVKLVVPFAAGGVVDAVARHFSEKMSALVGSFVVENQGGAGGLLGASAVRRADPDGQTLLFGDTSSLTIAPYMKDNPPYDALTDFLPISMLATSSTSVVVHPNIPANSLKEFIDYARKNTGKLSYGSAGVGTVTHLAGESLKQRAGLPELDHVPYRGAGPALNDVVAGMVQVATPNITGQVLELHRAGKIRILAVLSPQRLAAVPEIPTASETVPDLVVRLSCGVIAPAKTPDAIASRLEAAAAKVLADQDFAKVLSVSGLEPWKEPGSANARKFLALEREQLLPIMKAAGLRAA
ncbi:tripartite tricarboxylate transporter substrate binding protein [Bosea sp. BK604]|uniref:Bug family tripartite tricarboxylate transporter substrate binding protein n=1 Tax=Bosea sp. BK604 TaxID=2512180 RepID=UPI0010ED4526|nr:tripartite tricarboxylate transporter substrate binding protein [Bosea sp. BK604]TCR63690.1 tripartite-type tricarboxylate transporter receptor subunit TctC [Bosea sp. BK604]